MGILSALSAPCSRTDASARLIVDMNKRPLPTERAGILAAGGILAGLPPVAVFLYLIAAWVVLPAAFIAIAMARATPRERIELVRTYFDRAPQ